MQRATVSAWYGLTFCWAVFKTAIQAAAATAADGPAVGQADQSPGS